MEPMIVMVIFELIRRVVPLLIALGVYAVTIVAIREDKKKLAWRDFVPIVHMFKLVKKYFKMWWLAVPGLVLILFSLFCRLLGSFNVTLFLNSACYTYGSPMLPIGAEPGSAIADARACEMLQFARFANYNASLFAALGAACFMVCFLFYLSYIGGKREKSESGG